MLDSAQIVYLPPEKCVSRQDEINGDKSEQKLTFSADGSIKVTKQAMQLRCETSGELKLRQCYLRRALAFDQVGLAGFTVQESWHNRMFQALLNPPPAGYRYTTTQQIIAADQKYWQVVSQESRALVIGVGTAPPLDVHLKAAATNPFVLACLTPLPKRKEKRVRAARVQDEARARVKMPAIPPKMHLSRCCLTHCRRDVSGPTRRTGSSALSLTRESADSSAVNRAGSGSTAAAITRAATRTSPLSSASAEPVRNARRRPTRYLLD